MKRYACGTPAGAAVNGFFLETFALAGVPPPIAMCRSLVLLSSFPPPLAGWEGKGGWVPFYKVSLWRRYRTLESKAFGEGCLRAEVVLVHGMVWHGVCVGCGRGQAVYAFAWNEISAQLKGGMVWDACSRARQRGAKNTAENGVFF
ncbi:hypothetical protein BS50DRAFT_110680 [Corynespora cassiicola Philippines]|uniref:Uncharacterized protein n=1 Tax=Corynespora cassiicola Philippines TaxID=1448308 RepID=A0A2T2NEB6_CORCC|nr:hypothetical protein BS50DRAFT_110680 [Corynespora cassiicola Philippines]